MKGAKNFVCVANTDYGQCVVYVTKTRDDLSGTVVNGYSAMGKALVAAHRLAGMLDEVDNSLESLSELVFPDKKVAKIIVAIVNTELKTIKQ